MHISCVICSDLITGSDDIFAINCGHLFHYNCVIKWLENSKTCPQCRSKASEKNIHRVYLNIANIDGSDDPSSLQNKIDSLKFNLKMKDAEVKSAKEERADMEKKNKALRTELKKTEEKVETLNGALLCTKERMNYLKYENKRMNTLQEENKLLQSRIDTLQGLETVRVGSASEVDELLNSLAGKSPESRSLATYCSVLKRELQEMERKRKMTQTRMAEHSQNLSKLYAERDSLKEALKINDKTKTNLNEELFNAKEEISLLEKKVQKQNGIIQNMQHLDTPSSALSILAKLRCGSPTRESTATEMLRILAESPAPDELLSTLKRVARSPKRLYPPTECETLKRSLLEEKGCLTPEILLPSKRNVQSLGFPKPSDPTQENTGPRLKAPQTLKKNVQTSSFPKLSDPTKEDLGLIGKPSSSGSQLKTEHRHMTTLHAPKQGFSIFQKTRLCSRPEESLHKKPVEEVYYDGMGGQRKHDIFPNPKRSMTSLGAKPKLKRPAYGHVNTGLPRIESFLSSPSQ